MHVGSLAVAVAKYKRKLGSDRAIEVVVHGVYYLQSTMEALVRPFLIFRGPMLITQAVYSLGMSPFVTALPRTIGEVSGR